MKFPDGIALAVAALLLVGTGFYVVHTTRQSSRRRRDGDDEQNESTAAPQKTARPHPRRLVLRVKGSEYLKYRDQRKVPAAVVAEWLREIDYCKDVDDDAAVDSLLAMINVDETLGDGPLSWVLLVLELPSGVDRLVKMDRGRMAEIVERLSSLTVVRQARFTSADNLSTAFK